MQTDNPLPPLSANPLVSVIMPSYNQGRYIADAIDSVLAQDYRPIEVLVMDGASKDDTLDVLRRYEGREEVCWWSEPDSGIVEAVNKGFARARGAVAAIQSSDDMYMPGAISTAVDAMRASPAPGLVYGDTATVDDAGAELFREAIGAYSLERFLAKATWIPQPSAFFRLALVKEIGGWNDAYFVTDTEFWLRMVFRTQVRKLDACLSRRRRHGEQRDTQVREICESYWRMIDESADLARAPRGLRRAAACGKYRHGARYNAGGRWLTAYAMRWRAAAVYPRALAWMGVAWVWQAPLVALLAARRKK